MSSDPNHVKPAELVNCGLIDTLSMVEFQPDQRMVREALNEDTQQGGVCGYGFMSTGATQPAGNRGTVPFGQFPGRPT